MANRENLTKLSTELRSGKYPQGRKALRTNHDSIRTNDDGYCCLGVGCDISGLGKWENRGRWYYSVPAGDATSTIDYANRLDEDMSSSILPKAVAKWLGIDMYGTFKLDGHDNVGEFDLAMLNDGNFTFDQIADIIDSPVVIFDPND